MRRRELLALAMASMLEEPCARAAKQQEMPRVAVIFPDSPGFDEPLREQLGARGLVQGRNVSFHWRSYKTWDEAMDSLVADVVDSRPRVIMVYGTPATRAVLRRTDTIPVVFDVGDPLASGLVSSLSRPGRNATGVSTTSVEGSAKLLDLVMQLVPDARTIMVVRNVLNPLVVKMADQIHKLAASARLAVTDLDAHNAEELVTALGNVDKRQADAVVVPTDLVFHTQRERIVEAARSTRLPVVFQERAFAVAGGLVSYGPDPKEASYDQTVCK